MRVNTFLFIAIGILVVVALVTYSTWLWQDNVSDSAAAINGFVSPLIGLISIILLYQTLYKQNEQIKHQAELLDTENSEKFKANIITQLMLIKELLYGFDWYDDNDNYHKGKLAWEERCLYGLEEYKRIENKNTSSHPENLLNYIVSSLINNYELIDKNNLIKQEDKMFLKDYYRLHFNLHFKPVLDYYQTEIINNRLHETSQIMNELLAKITLLLKISSEIIVISNVNDRLFDSESRKP